MGWLIPFGPGARPAPFTPLPLNPDLHPLRPQAQSRQRIRLVRYVWRTHGRRDCPRCAEMEGTIASRGAWDLGLQPGFHRGCDCTLEPVISEVDAPLVRRLPVVIGGQPLRVALNGLLTGSLAALRPAPADWRERIKE